MSHFICSQNISKLTKSYNWKLKTENEKHVGGNVYVFAYYIYILSYILTDVYIYIWLFGFYIIFKAWNYQIITLRLLSIMMKMKNGTQQ